MKFRITAAFFFSLLAVAACSSDNNSSDDMTATADPSTDTSQPTMSADDGELPPSSEPGGDTSAIAGIWDAATEVEGEGLDQRYVLISSDGLYTEYDYRNDAVASDGNCYIPTGPLTLTLEDAETNTYSLADDRVFTAITGLDTLSIQFEGGEPQQWAALTGLSVEELPACT